MPFQRMIFVSMKIINSYLNPQESKALEMLSKDMSYAAVKRDCLNSEGKCASQALPVFMQGIRKKTGIMDLHDAQEVRAYLEKCQRAAATPPTDEQLNILRRVLGIGYVPHTMEALANNTGRTKPEALQAWQDALRAIGIFATDPATQRVQAACYFASNTPFVQPVEPFTPKQWQALRLYSQGASFHAIASELGLLREEYGKEVVRRVCEKLGISARGRGVQRKLAALALKQAGKEHEVTMDDPAF
jgi:hypothetical protein